MKNTLTKEKPIRFFIALKDSKSILSAVKKAGINYSWGTKLLKIFRYNRLLRAYVKKGKRCSTITFNKKGKEVYEKLKMLYSDIDSLNRDR